MWAYSRVDTVRENLLRLVRDAGVKWLALGIEAGNQMVRREISKGSFKDVNIREICGMVKDHDIKLIAYNIVCFP